MHISLRASECTSMMNATQQPQSELARLQIYLFSLRHFFKLTLLLEIYRDSKMVCVLRPFLQAHAHHHRLADNWQLLQQSQHQRPVQQQLAAPQVPHYLLHSSQISLLLSQRLLNGYKKQEIVFVRTLLLAKNSWQTLYY